MTWPVTPIDRLLIVLIHNNQLWNRIMISQLVSHYANKTVITVIYSIVLGYCIAINVLMKFQISTSLSITSLPLISNLEFKSIIRCCIMVKRGKVFVSLQRCYRRNGFKTIWGCKSLGYVIPSCRGFSCDCDRNYSVTDKLCSYPQGLLSAKFKLLIFARKVV